MAKEYAKLMNRRVACGWAVWVMAILCWQYSAHAAFYNNQTYYGDGASGPIGSGSLRMSNGTYTVYASMTNGMHGFYDNLVMFIDSAPGGYTSTRQFSDKANALEIAVSGYKTLRSTADFASGFAADYAIVLGVDTGSAVYKLVDDGTGPHLQLVRSGLNVGPPGDPNSPVHYFQFDWADIGLPDLKTNFFKFETTYVTATGYRYLQSFEGLTGTEGFDFITFTNYDTYGVQPVPENTNAALAIFGGIVASVALTHRLRRPCSTG